ncbi:hypothetical protein ZIOFF_037120 [Zingiber officinale]|uniref:Uncharacterized protein n=1 Tax=Zingiber officinale TaxID=94328 RepID=A0A8J5KZ92_ZINOF|nr:hypothetical protein ZIOFF_037120 [Zingiber officinale]
MIRKDEQIIQAECMVKLDKQVLEDKLLIEVERNLKQKADKRAHEADKRVIKADKRVQDVERRHKLELEVERKKLKVEKRLLETKWKLKLKVKHQVIVAERKVENQKHEAEWKSISFSHPYCCRSHHCSIGDFSFDFYGYTMALTSVFFQTFGFILLGGVQLHALNVTGLAINTAGGLWYLYAKYQQKREFRARLYPRKS